MDLSVVLRDIANRQYGYFSASQANDAGYGKELQHYHAINGNWLKIDRGLFRLKGFTDCDESEFTRWSLWAMGRSRDQVCAVSHESALYHYKLLHEKPTAIHLTILIPLRRKKIPQGCICHCQELAENELLQKQGFHLTTPVRTLSDMKPDLILNQKWGETVRQARARCLLSDQEMRDLLSDTYRIQYATLPASAEKGEIMPEYANSATGWKHPANALAPSRPYSPIASEFRRNPVHSQKAFTLVEILVVVSIIAILAMLMMPALRTALDSSRAVFCANNLKQWCYIMNHYAEDWKDHFPASKIGHSVISSWYDENDVIESYAAMNSYARRKAFTCPNWRGAKQQDYAPSYCLWYPDMSGDYYAPPVSYSRRPSKLVLLFDARAQSETAFYTWLASGNSSYTWTISWVNGLKSMVYNSAADQGWSDAYRHPNRSFNAAFWDSHVAPLREVDLTVDPTHAAPDRAK